MTRDVYSRDRPLCVKPMQPVCITPVQKPNTKIMRDFVRLCTIIPCLLLWVLVPVNVSAQRRGVVVRPRPVVVVRPRPVVHRRVYASPRRVYGAPARPAFHIQAAKVLRRTHYVLNEAYAAVRIGQVYTGNLSMAVRHQRFARALYRRGLYARAIHHSRFARAEAIAAIQVNRRTVAAELNDLSDVPQEVGLQPDSQQLQSELKSEMPEATTTDQQILEKGLPADTNLDPNE
jgi:hypothetical protein